METKQTSYQYLVKVKELLASEFKIGDLQTIRND